MSTYLSRTVFDIRPQFDRPSIGVLDDHTYDSSGVGAFTPWKVTTGPKRRVTYPFILGTRSESKAFRMLIATAHGRRTGFWLPIWSMEYRLTSTVSAGATQITVQRVTLDEAESAFSQFKNLFLADQSGKLECYQISSVAISGDTEVITLSAALTTDAVSTTDICGGLIFARLADDRIDYAFRSHEACECRVTFVELPQEYTTAHEGSAPLFLYEFTRGATISRYAGSLATVSAGGFSWASADITHGELSNGIEFLDEPLEIRLATDDAAHPLRYFLDRNGLDRVTARVFETDADAPSIPSTPLFSGQIRSVIFGSRGELVAKCSSVHRHGRRSLPGVQIQRLCNHRLYSAGCGLDETDWDTTGTIDAIQATDPPWVEASEFGDKATAESDANWFALGKVVVGSETRLCVGQSGNRLYLNAPFKSAVVGNPITASAGCDKRVGTCDSKFSNTANFLGFPYIPNVNPNLEPMATPEPKRGKKG